MTKEVELLCFFSIIHFDVAQSFLSTYRNSWFSSNKHKTLQNDDIFYIIIHSSMKKLLSTETPRIFQI